jgi:hypothetical protein
VPSRRNLKTAINEPEIRNVIIIRLEDDRVFLNDDKSASVSGANQATIAPIPIIDVNGDNGAKPPIEESRVNWRLSHGCGLRKRM